MCGDIESKRIYCGKIKEKKRKKTDRTVGNCPVCFFGGMQNISLTISSIDNIIKSDKISILDIYYHKYTDGEGDAL